MANILKNAFHDMAECPALWFGKASGLFPEA